MSNESTIWTRGAWDRHEPGTYNPKVEAFYFTDEGQPCEIRIATDERERYTRETGTTLPNENLTHREAINLIHWIRRNWLEVESEPERDIEAERGDHLRDLAVDNDE